MRYACARSVDIYTMIKLSKMKDIRVYQGVFMSMYLGEGEHLRGYT